MVHFAIDLEFEKVGGNIYMNFTLGGLVVMVAGFVVVLLKSIFENYHRVNSIVLFLIFSLVTSFFWAPLDLIVCPVMTQTFYITLLVIILFFYEISGILIVIEINNYVRIHQI